MGKSLFEQVRIGTVTLGNRFVRSATWEGMCTDDGAVTPQLLDCYRALVRGGIGLVISGYSYVRPEGKQLPGKMGIDDDRLNPGLLELTTTVHELGGTIFCQLVHAGGQTSSDVIGRPPLAPSAIDFPTYQSPPQALKSREITEIVQAFAEAAARAQRTGFDGVQLHGAHGYLINQFLSPLTNQRDDQYGGDLGNRMRFLEEVCCAVRAAVGQNYPVTIKLTAADHMDGGLTIEDTVQVAKRLEELGIDAIEVSSGTPASGELGPVRQKVDTPEKEAYNASLARKIKASVDIPIMVVGGIRSHEVLQRLLWEADADLFAFSRPLIREPDLPRKFQEDEGYRSSCISCNGCFKPALKGKGISCILDKVEEENRNPQV